MRSTLIIFIFYFSFAALAQNKIKGIVVDEKQEPIPTTSVLVLDKEGKNTNSTITDTLGRFSLNVNPKLYSEIRFKSLGFKDKAVKLNSLSYKDINTITLKDTLLTIDDIHVKASKLLVNAEKDIFLISDKDRKNTPTASELITDLPLFSLNHFNNKITTNEGKRVLLLLNGIRTNEEKLLSINPKEIQKIEHYELPPARYSDLNLTSVINVITFNRKQKGFDLSTNLNNSYSDIFGTNVLNIEAYDSINSFNVQYFIDYRGFDDIKKNQSYFYNKKNYHAIYEGLPSEYRGTYNKLSTEYKRNTSKYLFSGELVYRNSNGYEKYNQRATHSGMEIVEREYRHRELDDQSNSIALDLYYSRKLRNDQSWGINIVNTISGANSKSKLSTSNSLKSDNSGIYSDFNDNESNSIIGETFYTKPLKKHRLTIGFRNSYKHLSQIYNNQYSSDIYQNISYLYSGLSGKFKKISYTYNLGVQNTHAKYESNNSITQNDIVLKSSLSLSTTVNSVNKFRYNAYLSSNVPSITELANNQVQIDDFLIYRGNYNISPYYVVGNQFKYQLNFEKVYISYLARYQVFLEPYQATFIDENQYILKTYQHQEKLQDAYTSLFISWKPFKQFVIQPIYGFSYVSNQYTGNRTEKLASHYFSLKATLSHKSWKLILEDIEPYKNLQGDIVTEVGRSAYGQLSFTKKNLTLAAWYWHQPEPVSSRSISNVISLNENKVWDELQNVFGIKLNYFIHTGNKKTRNNKKRLRNEDRVSGLSKENTVNFK
ncbi:TonB-dependent receptor family protein [Halosquirtibacter laminarini]|uniref:TonB-dependent receptor family protein n=1 Tax=Halosquirtibacter laminarini TaxID=3374600 RepID=A0AC61NQ06_9BACT|nr:TonB-dependent receptor family protein [Prolixibacteraceae bacterium]